MQDAITILSNYKHYAGAFSAFASIVLALAEQTLAFQFFDV